MTAPPNDNVLRALSLYDPESREPATRILESLRVHGIEQAEPPTDSDSGLVSGDNWRKTLLDNWDAIVVFASKSTFAESRMRLLMGELPVEFEQVLQSAPHKIILVMLQRTEIPDSLSSMPAYQFFDHDESDFDSAVERLAYFVRGHVEMRKTLEQQSPQEGLKTTESPSVEDVQPTTVEEAVAEEPASTSESPDLESETDGRGNSDTIEERDEPPPVPAKAPAPPYAVIALTLFAVGLIFAGNYLDRRAPVIRDGILYEEYAKEVVAEFLLVRPQSFLMGSQSLDSHVDERPAHNVDLTAPLLVGIHEVTNKLYGEYLAATEARYGPADPFADDSRDGWPVVNVSWEDAEGFARWFSQETNASYRLPAESEWEWLAQQSEGVLEDPCEFVNFRSGSLYAGLSASTNELLGPQPEGSPDCSSPVLVEVDAISPDYLGLYHLFGNAAEWVQDCYAGSYLAAMDDGSASDSGNCEYRVFRGGSWLSRRESLTPRFRSFATPDYRDFNIGFRLVRELDWIDSIALDRPGTNWDGILPLAVYTSYGGAALSFAAFIWLIRRGRATK